MKRKIIKSTYNILATFPRATTFAFSLRKNLRVSKEYIKEKYKQPYSYFIKWRNVEIHYTEKGTGFPILMIHGFGSNHTDFSPLQKYFSKKYRVINIDLPGFGMSDFPVKHYNGINYQHIYNDFFDFILNELNLLEFYLIGSSMGGMISWNLTHRYPEKIKKLILLNSAGYDMKNLVKESGFEFVQSKLIKNIMKKGIPRFITDQGINRIFYRKEFIDEYFRQRNNDFWNREDNIEHIFNFGGSAQYPDEHKIKEITTPTLIIWGKHDNVTRVKYASRFKQDLRNSELIIYNDCGHAPMIEIPDKLCNNIEHFLNKQSY